MEGSRYSNAALLDNNSNLQAEADALNNHIRVVTHQNKELSQELDAFVQANEAIRQRLDRKNRVLEIRDRYSEKLAHSYSQVQESRSPMKSRAGL